MMFKQYLQVTKPGIIFGNLISVIGGFLLASKGSIDYPLFIYTLVAKDDAWFRYLQVLLKHHNRRS